MIWAEVASRSEKETNEHRTSNVKSRLGVIEGMNSVYFIKLTEQWETILRNSELADLVFSVIHTSGHVKFHMKSEQRKS